MHRRRLLRFLAVGSVLGLGGCTELSPPTPDTNNQNGNRLAQNSQSTQEEPAGQNQVEQKSAEQKTVTEPARPGHSFEGAPQVPEGRNGPYELDLRSRDSENREHYFAVDLREGDELTVTTHFSRYDLDMSVHSPETNYQHEQYESRPRYREIATSWSTTNNETINITASTSGTHYIRTYIVTYGVTSTYELEVQIE